MLGYLANVRIGSALYNLVHITAIPAAIAAYSFTTHRTGTRPFSLIWLAHIGWDGAIGYGLKYATFFKDIHLQRVAQPSHFSRVKNRDRMSGASNLILDGEG